MASFNLPFNLGTLQGVALGYPYLFPFGSDQPKVGIFDNNGNPALASASIMRMEKNPEILLPEHPLEDGTSTMDHRVIRPIEIRVSLIAEKDNYRSVYADLVNFAKSGALFQIAMRVGTYSNMALSAYPHEENPDMFDAISMELNFRQMLFVVPAQGTMSSSNTANPYDTNTVQQGMTSPNGTFTLVNSDAFQQAVNASLQGGRP